jgi:hypothetical protein
MDARNPTTFRIFTTLLDPAEVTAVDLVAAYMQRWEIELTLDELKIRQPDRYAPAASPTTTHPTPKAQSSP